MRRPLLLLSIAATASAVLGSLLASPVAAHTESDVVAVPAGAEATVKLKPTHGCDGSPTIAVAIQAPVEGATAQEVDGWTATATADGEGNTVLEWTEGSLPADQTGEFPVDFTAPDTPGELLTFPSVQTCDNDEELSWISGDPAGEFPAPRVLILPAGSPPAPTVDDVPADAPGRDQLAEIVDVDNPDEPESPTTEAPPTETTVPDTAEAEDDQAIAPAPDASDDEAEGDSPNTAFIVAVVVALLLAGGVAAYVYLQSRTKSADASEKPGDQPEAT